MTTERASLQLSLAGMGQAARNDFDFWSGHLEPILALPTGICAALERVARATNTPLKTVQRKFYALKAEGPRALIDRRLAGPAFWKTRGQVAISEDDKELVKTYCERYQRNSAAGIRQLRRDWLHGKIHTATPVDSRTGYPRGWSVGNLMRYGPSDFEKKAARIGRSAAAAHRPLVYTTRRYLYVGQYYLFDDIWHDHEVNLLDTAQRGRPLEFHGLDLASACKIAWGMRIRREVDGVNEGLKGGDFRFLLGTLLTSEGYHPDGTTLILEWGTTTVSERIERILFDATRGAIRFARSGMEGAAAHAGQYAGRSKGNFRFKAALESLGNLIHNEMAALPGQTGKDRQHAPEQQYGLQKRNDALLMALSSLPLERAQWLLWPLCSFQQFQSIAQEIYARINARTEHNLEGWDDRYVPDPRRGGMRRLSPTEVWRSGRRPLRPIAPEIAALVVGTDGGVERLTRNGMIELREAEISGDVLRFDATALPDREKFLTVLNPFDARQLTCFNARGAWVATLERLQSVCRSDAEAVQRACGAAAKREATLLAPLRRRHAAEGRERAAAMNHNARVLDTKRPFTTEERNALSRIRKVQGSLSDLTDVGPAQLSGAESENREVSVITGDTRMSPEEFSSAPDFEADEETGLSALYAQPEEEN